MLGAVLPYQSPFDIQAWLDDLPPYQERPPRREPNYWEQLKTTENKALRLALLSAFTQYYGVKPMDADDQVELIKGCYEMYQGAKSHDIPCVFYRLATLDDIQEKIFTDIVKSGSQRYIKYLLADFSRLVASDDPNERLNKLLARKVIQETYVAANEVDKAYIREAVQKELTSDEMRQRAVDVENHFLIFLEQLTQSGVSPKPVRILDLKFHYMNHLAMRKTPEEIAEKLQQYIEKHYQWKLKENAKFPSASIFKALAAGINRDMISQDYRTLQIALLEVLECHPDMRKYFRAERQQLAESEAIYQPREGHTLDKNMLWLNGALRGMRSFLCLADMNVETLFRRNFPEYPSAFAIEFAVAYRAGAQLERREDGLFIFVPDNRCRDFQYLDAKHNMRDVYERIRMIETVVEVLHKKRALGDWAESKEMDQTIKICIERAESQCDVSPYAVRFETLRDATELTNTNRLSSMAALAEEVDAVKSQLTENGTFKFKYCNFSAVSELSERLRDAISALKPQSQQHKI